MSLGLVSTRKLVDKKVFGGKDHAKHLGKVKAFIFHPNEKRCVGFVVKRPDVALMFHRDDLFVAFDSFTIEDDGDVFVSQNAGATGDAACKRLGVDWNTCLVWRGLPVVTEAGETIGIVGDVVYEGRTGAVQSLKVDANASANALLGKRNIDAELIKGFRTGIGAPLLSSDMAEYNDDAAVVCGGILVANEVKDIVTEGLADMAGRKAGELSVKARMKAAQAKPKAEALANTAKDVASRGAQTAGKAINKGAKFAGERLAQTKSAIEAFKEEYDKAMRDEASDDSQGIAAQSDTPQPPQTETQSVAPKKKVRKVKKVRVEKR
ncbi:MAG: PRC-barrel domain-containing protein [Eggerthellaceae bacterium]|nr:PRC-barrel domain-containing protein [Eggerthellaceae bacterium]